MNKFKIMKQLYIIIATLFVVTFSNSQDINLTVTVPDGTTAVRLTGPWWNWDPNGGPEATDNGDNTWTVTMAAPTENMEYLWVVDGVQESLVASAGGGGCTVRIDAGELITDYNIYANRVWVQSVGGDVLDNAYGTCSFVTSTDFENDGSIRGWTGVGDANTTDTNVAALSRATTGGNPDGALSLFANNPDEAGKNYQFQVTDADYNYFSGASLNVSFQAKGDLVGVGVHFVVNSTRNDDLQAQGLNNNTWTDYSFDIPVSPTGATDDLVLRFEMAAGAFSGAGGTLLIDNLTLTTSGTASEPAAPTDAPTTPPTRDAADVISIYGEAYGAAVGLNAVGWDGGSDTTEETIAGNAVLKTTFADFIGFDLGSEIDASDMTHMHLDIWISDAFAGGQVFKPTFSNWGGDGSAETDKFEYLYEVGATDAESWVSLDLPFSDWTLLSGAGSDGRANLKQFLIAVAGTLNTVYIDNIYLYKSATASINDLESTFSVYPNPVQNTLNVSAGATIDNVSIFDLTGRQVLRATPNAAAFSLDVADLNKGLYLISLKAGDQEMITKLVK